MDIRTQTQIERATKYTAARRLGNTYRFWDATRATWYAVSAAEMAELGELLLDWPAEKSSSYDTWIDKYCDHVDADQTNRDGYPI